LQTLTGIRVRVVGQGLFSAELEHFRSQRDTLRVPEAAIQVDDNSHMHRLKLLKSATPRFRLTVPTQVDRTPPTRSQESGPVTLVNVQPRPPNWRVSAVLWGGRGCRGPEVMRVGCWLSVPGPQHDSV